MGGATASILALAKVAIGPVSEAAVGSSVGRAATGRWAACPDSDNNVLRIAASAGLVAAGGVAAAAGLVAAAEMEADARLLVAGASAADG